jgi:hypothetical protein
MKNFQQKENKVILIVFIAIILIFGALFAARDYIFDYINKGADSNGYSSNIDPDIVNKEFEIEQESLLDISVFEKEKFQELKEWRISLPEFKAGKNNPFNINANE